jgi:hypothetical protein
MDAASYAVERNRNLQDNVQKIIQMMLMGKQNKQEQDWRQGQFDYQKEQNAQSQGFREKEFQRLGEGIEYQKGQNAINQEQENRTAQRMEEQMRQTAEYQRLVGERQAERDRKTDEHRKALLAVPKTPPVTSMPVSRYGRSIATAQKRYVDEIKKIEDDIGAIEKKETSGGLESFDAFSKRAATAGIPREQHMAKYQEALAVSGSAKKQTLAQRLKALRSYSDELGVINSNLQNYEDLSPDEVSKLQFISGALGKISTPAEKAQVKPGTAPDQVAAPTELPEKPPSFEEVKKNKPGTTKEQYDRAVERWNRK